MRSRTTWRFTLTAAIALLAGCQTTGTPDVNDTSTTHVRYVEIVSRDAAAQIAALEQVHELSFGPTVADLGEARVSEAPDGSLVGVRAPLDGQEQPVVRTYLRVDDIERAVKQAEAAGAMIAYPPTRQGVTGTWAIYILGEIQIGLWQQ